MTVKLKMFSTHLGDHDKTEKSIDHRLSTPTEEYLGYQLPFITFHAINLQQAERFIRGMNWIADEFKMDAMNLANLVYHADALMIGRG